MFEAMTMSGFTTGWVLYAAVLGALAGVAALGIETLLRWRGLPGRWTWVVAGVVTASVPVGALFFPEREAVESEVAASPVVIDRAGSGEVLRAEAVRSDGAETGSAEANGSPIPAALAARAEAVGRGVVAALETPLPSRWVGGVWAAGSGLVLLLLVGTSILTLLRARTWPRTDVLGRSVHLSAGTGPAAVGAWRPRIVLPRWMLSLDEEDLRTVLDHEDEHRRAGDLRVLAGFALLLAAMPWNPALWWQLRRLRAAVEADCDRRTLRRRPDADPRRYGLLLLEASRRGGRGLLPASALGAALGPRARDLRRRIELLGGSGPKGRTVVLAAGLALASTALACDLPRPTAPADVEEAAVLDLTAADATLEDVVEPRLADRAAFDERVRTTARLPQLRDAEGVVAMRLVVDERGGIEKLVVDHVEGPSVLADAAVQLAGETRLEPATVEGEPVKALVPFWVMASPHALKATLVDPEVYRDKGLPGDRDALVRLMETYRRLAGGARMRLPLASVREILEDLEDRASGPPPADGPEALLVERLTTIVDFLRSSGDAESGLRNGSGRP